MRLLKLRNPWGHTEADTEWSSGGSAWDGEGEAFEDKGYSGQQGAEQIKATLMASQFPDGSFWMSWEDFGTAFATVIMLKPTPDDMYTEYINGLIDDSLSWAGIKNIKDKMLHEANRNQLSETDLELAYKSLQQKWRNCPRLYIQCKGRPAETYFKFELYERPSGLKSFCLHLWQVDASGRDLDDRVVRKLERQVDKTLKKPPMRFVTNSRDATPINMRSVLFPDRIYMIVPTLGEDFGASSEFWLLIRSMAVLNVKYANRLAPGQVNRVDKEASTNAEPVESRAHGDFGSLT